MKYNILIIISMLFTIMVNAQNPVIPGEDKTGSPYFEIISDDPSVDKLPLRSTTADVNIAGVIADIKITQEYKNEGKSPIEAIYVFPASTRAAIYRMVMTIGERTIEAKISEKSKAREEYEKAKQEGKTASLLEQKRPNVFQMNVGNIMPGDVIKVELHYTELLVPEEGMYEFVFPTVVGPRYAGEVPYNSSPAAEGWVDNPYTAEGVGPTYTFDIDVNIAAGIPIKDIRCTSHNVDLNYLEADRVFVDLKSTEKNRGNKDYILQYRLKGKQIASGVLLYEGKEENFFLAMVQPPKQVLSEQLPPREYVFIVDVSGSMNGYPLNTSKELLKDLIGSLKPSDRFNVVLFASASQILSETSLPATPENISKALNLIDRRQGGGGTNLLAALNRALALQGTEDYSRSFVIATDGYVAVEKQAFDLIRNNLNNANFFAFGIGNSVNRFIIEGLAHVGSGEAFIITGPQHAAAEAERFRKYIEHPVLTNIKLNFEGFDAYDLEPSSIPDVLSERPVIIRGKWKGEAGGRVVLTATSGSGDFRREIRISKRNNNNKNIALKYLWAREKIRLLDDYAGIGAQGTDHEKMVTDIGLKYNLITAYTSFLAIDSEIRNKTGLLASVNQPLPLPEGVSNMAVSNFYVNGVALKCVKAMGVPVIREARETSSSDMSILNEIEIIEVVEDKYVEAAFDVVALKDIDEEEIFVIVEVMPEFEGGRDALAEFIKNNITYPEDARITGITGKVFVEFIIGKDGNIRHIRIKKGLHPSLDREAINVIKLTSGKWKPGMLRGKAVDCKFVLPVEFRF